MLVQFDASHHPWLEDRSPRLVLHAAVDDATSKVLAAWFDDEETAAGYFEVFRQIALGPGLPLAAYTDRHGIFKRASPGRWTLEEQLLGQRAPTQVGRLLQELGIHWVPASSPQAKGRIERVFGALQDRLVAELRLARITDKKAANAFLPRFLRRYNARFARPAAHPHPVYRPWPAGRDPATVFCFKYTRTVANDHTITLGPHTLQILPNGRSYAKARVEVHERLDGTFAILYRGTRLALRRLSPRPRSGIRVHRTQRPGPAKPRRMPVKVPGSARRTRRPWKPDADHPWRVLTRQMIKLRAARAERTKSLSS
jgi:hypothetical protein